MTDLYYHIDVPSFGESESETIGQRSQERGKLANETLLKHDHGPLKRADEMHTLAYFATFLAQATC
jgi:hypothetical protein